MRLINALLIINVIFFSAGMFPCKDGVCHKLTDGTCLKEQLQRSRDNCWQRLINSPDHLISEDMLDLLAWCKRSKTDNISKVLLSRYISLVSTKYPTMQEEAFGITPANYDELKFIVTGKMKWFKEQESLMDSEEKGLFEVAQQFLSEVD